MPLSDLKFKFRKEKLLREPIRLVSNLKISFPSNSLYIFFKSEVDT